MLGICGTGMGSLAGLLKSKGYKVTGSDQNVYPPMSTQLEKLGIQPFAGYKPSNLDVRPDLVIVGNVVRKDNPEVVAVLDRKIPYLSLPQALANIFLKDQDPIVVTGTHGKTTTANILAWLLEHAKAKPSFLIGGVGLNFGKSYRYSAGKYFVIEGDEYDTAFFDKGPKFLHYKPKFAIIGSIEFDHADIYKDLDHIKEAFKKFVELIPSSGLCLVGIDSSATKDIIKFAACKTITYGFSKDAECRITNYKPTDLGSNFDVTYSGKSISFSLPLSGRHNALNAAAALILLLELGFDAKKLSDGLKKFIGVKRRQEVKGVVDSITVIDDFAHHPTAIRETVMAMKAKYKSGRLWAIFEPRSNTTRRKIFEKDFASAFSEADETIIAEVFNVAGLSKEERLDPENVVAGINKAGGSAHYIRSTDEIVRFVTEKAKQGDTILVMSNGAFDDIHNKLLINLKKLHHS